jgi:hypothetical protein
MNEAELTEAALEKLRRGETPGNVAAILVGSAGPPDLDGDRWKLFATDGRKSQVIDADLSGSEGVKVAEGERDQSRLEAAVELHAINDFPIETRMADLAEASPISLRAEDFR